MTLDISGYICGYIKIKKIYQRYIQIYRYILDISVEITGDISIYPSIMTTDISRIYRITLDISVDISKKWYIRQIYPVIYIDISKHIIEKIYPTDISEIFCFWYILFLIYLGISCGYIRHIYILSENAKTGH